MKTLLLLGLFSLSVMAFADPSPTPVPTAVDPGAFISQVASTASGFGTLPMAAKVSAVIMLLIASMKVSVLDSLVWDKLGKFQIWIAPILGLVAGVLLMKPFSWSGLFVYAGAGAGAVFLHELLDLIKLIPGLGAIYVSAINLVENALGGNPVGAQGAVTPVATPNV